MLSKTRRFFAAVVLMVMSAWCVPAAPALAFGHHKAIVGHRSFVQRHKTVTSIAAGVAAYKLAKITARNRALHGRRLNFAQRHPFLTGVGAAAVTHHMLKKSDRRR